MLDFVIGDKWGQATLESCREVDAMFPNSEPLVAPATPCGRAPLPLPRAVAAGGILRQFGFEPDPLSMGWRHRKTGVYLDEELIDLIGIEAAIRRVVKREHLR